MNGFAQIYVPLLFLSENDAFLLPATYARRRRLTSRQQQLVCARKSYLTLTVYAACRLVADTAAADYAVERGTLILIGAGVRVVGTSFIWRTDEVTTRGGQDRAQTIRVSKKRIYLTAARVEWGCVHAPTE